LDEGDTRFQFGGEYRLSSTKSTNGGSVQTGSIVWWPTWATQLASEGIAGGVDRYGRVIPPGPTNCRKSDDVLAVIGPTATARAVSQTRFTNSSNGQWNDFTRDGIFKVRDIAQNEIAAFFKDD
jgi:hypothetical protein